jgi:hypothetical protein
MQWIVLIVTVLILAAIGQSVVNLHNAGQYWVWILAPVMVAGGIYRLGENEDRDYFHNGWAKLTGRPAPSENHEERPAPEEWPN